MRPVREVMLRVWRRPGKIVWEGTERRDWSRPGDVERVEGEREGASWERARRVAWRATEVLWRV